MASRVIQYLFGAISLSLIAILNGCSPAAPSQIEMTELAKRALKKYFSNLVKFQAHIEAENQSMQDKAQAMVDSFRSNPSSDSTNHKSEARIETELTTQADAQVENTLTRTNITIIGSGELGKADLIAPGGQAEYWPISFEASDPGHSDTKVTFEIFAYRNTAGKWDMKVKTVHMRTAGTSHELPGSMLKQLGL
jgi:hypothetical protein